MRKFNWALLVLTLYICSLLAPVPVVASDITAADYKGIITISNNGTATTNVSSNITNISIPSLISSGYITSSSNLSMVNTSGTDVAFMPGYATAAWMTYVPTITGSGYLSYLLYNNSTGGKLRYFPGAAGLTTNDAAGLELGGNFSIEIKGYVTSSGGVISKQNAFDCSVVTGNLEFWWIGAGGFTASHAISVGEHTIKLLADSTNFYMYIDDMVTPVTTNLIVNPIIDTAFNYVCFPNYTIPYVEYSKLTIGGTLKQHLGWQYAVILTDQSGWGNNPSAVSFAVASNDPTHITATLTSWLPIAQAQAPAYSLTSSTAWMTAPNMTGNFSTTISPSFPGFNVIRDIATASSTPEQLPLYLIATFMVLIFSLTFSWVSRRFSQPSVFVKILVIFALMGIGVAVEIFDVWMIVIFILLAVALAMGSRQQSWG